MQNGQWERSKIRWRWSGVIVISILFSHLHVHLFLQQNFETRVDGSFCSLPPGRHPDVSRVDMSCVCVSVCVIVKFLISNCYVSMSLFLFYRGSSAAIFRLQDVQFYCSLYHPTQYVTRNRESLALELSKLVEYSLELIRPSLGSTVITQALELKHTTSAVHSTH
jgi:hypothetical protein